MQRFVLVLSCIIVLVMFTLQGFQPRYALPDALLNQQEETLDTGTDPKKAIEDIYFTVSVMGIEDATIERLTTDFNIDPFIYTGLWGKYSDGRFGAADVIVMKPRPGMEADVREAMQTIKLSRMSLFKNYDIYNAYELAEDGTIIERGDYVILLMIDNKEEVTAIINQYIPR